MMKWILLLACALTPGWAEIIDRSAVTVGAGVITESEIMREIRLTAFLNGEPPDFSPESMRKTAERMVEQILILNDFETSRYPAPGPEAVDQMMQSVRGERFKDPGKYSNGLKALDLTEDEIKAHFLRQLITLRFIEFRFRPGVQVTEADVETYFRTRLVPELKKQRPNGEFPIGDFREQAEEALIGERIDREADQWLKASKIRTRIVFRPELLRAGPTR
ncbi:MAG: hypothetical protein ABIZ80_10170 [Bryobacteraceae bacterium]